MPRSSRRSAAHLGRSRKIDTMQDFMESIHNKLHARPTTDSNHNFEIATAIDNRFDTVKRIIEETQFYGS